MTPFEIIIESKNKNNGWMPMVSSAYRIVGKKDEYGDVNLGWSAGMVDENRPYYAECWAADGITMLTVYVSVIGIEDYTDEQVNNLIISTGYYKPKENFHEPEMMIFTDDNDNEFFAVNIVVGYEEDVFVDGAIIYPFSILNEINSAEK